VVYSQNAAVVLGQGNAAESNGPDCSLLIGRRRNATTGERTVLGKRIR
jgi:hypothetical protein